MTDDDRDPLLRVDDLRTVFHTDSGTVRAVDGVSLDVARGETVCLVGESGSGKTVLSESITRLIRDPPGEIAAGTVRFDGRDLLAASEREIEAIRGGRIAHVFQNPQDALNPVYTVGWQLIEAIRLHDDASKSEARARAIDLLERVGIPDPAGRVDDYPHEFSAGMKQRVAVAMALAGEPDLLVADEPTTALDVTIQSQVLRLLDALRAEFEMGILFVTHDLGVVAEVADRVVVLYDGVVMERGPVSEIFARPAHPYTRELLAAIPGREAPSRDDGDARRRRSDPVSGSAPDGGAHATGAPDGCRYRKRCPYAVDACRRGDQPPLYDVPAASSGHSGSDGRSGDGDSDGRSG
ncbi:MAG: ABC transporter ATP-binding protein, partial [Haloquadratum sp.]